jgi:type IV secretion system protein VirD4
MSIFYRIYLLNPFNKGLLLNGKRDRISQKNSFTHSLVVAPAGGGKTSSFIIPNIFTLDNCSILCTDLSGELYKKTSGKMKEKGFDIKIINPTKLDISNRYNPLSSIQTHKDILDTASILVNSGTNYGNDPFWNQGAKKLIEILITSLICQREQLKKLKFKDYDKFCNLANLRHLLNSFGKGGKGIDGFIKINSIGEHQNNYKEWKGFTSGNEKTTQSFLTNALNILSIIGNEDIAKLTSTNEIDFTQIRQRKTIVYLQIPQEDLETYSFLLNLFYSRFFNSCYKETSQNTLPVYCLLDEAGHTNIPSLATIITTIRKFRVSISLILQPISQLPKNKYTPLRKLYTVLQKEV